VFNPSSIKRDAITGTVLIGVIALSFIVLVRIYFPSLLGGQYDSLI
jgi:hypothetical protein